MLPALSTVSVYFHSPQTTNTKAAPVELGDGAIRTSSKKYQDRKTWAADIPRPPVQCEGQGSHCGRTSSVGMRKG